MMRASKATDVPRNFLVFLRIARVHCDSSVIHPAFFARAIVYGLCAHAIFRVTMTRGLPPLLRHELEDDRSRGRLASDALRLLASESSGLAAAKCAHPASLSPLRSG